VFGQLGEGGPDLHSVEQRYYPGLRSRVHKSNGKTSESRNGQFVFVCFGKSEAPACLGDDLPSRTALGSIESEHSRFLMVKSCLHAMVQSARVKADGIYP